MNSEYFKELLNKRGLRATPNRIEFLTLLEQDGEAVPYSQIQEAMNTIDRVTLYRTLETFISQGIIHKAYSENNETYYALCQDECSQEKHHHEHIHFKCNVCFSVTCQQPPQKIKISLPEHEIEQISINVKGTCKKCKEKAAA